MELGMLIVAVSDKETFGIHSLKCQWHFRLKFIHLQNVSGIYFTHTHARTYWMCNEV